MAWVAGVGAAEEDLQGAVLHAPGRHARERVLIRALLRAPDLVPEPRGRLVFWVFHNVFSY